MNDNWIAGTHSSRSSNWIRSESAPQILIKYAIKIWDLVMIASIYRFRAEAAAAAAARSSNRKQPNRHGNWNWNNGRRRVAIDAPAPGAYWQGSGHRSGLNRNRTEQNWTEVEWFSSKTQKCGCFFVGRHRTIKEKERETGIWFWVGS